MDQSVEFIEFAMIRDRSSVVSDRPLPDGFAIRTFEPGDERYWVDIEMRAGEFSTPERGHLAFDRDFRPGYDRLESQMFFLVHETDGPIGTATAWQGNQFGHEMGQLHWVAIVPEHQGKGLAKSLLAVVMRRIAEDHAEVYLTTQTSSWRAVGMYRAFGFSEVIDRPEVERAVAIVDAKLAESGR